ncbi:hypothetical protein ACU635_59055 [[Actinomadura] parvosata]|uniref:hypothetical protein n=1 Tax=[Actinomadura] parvosata TaxID=1955412 RepID=UPI00406CEE00
MTENKGRKAEVRAYAKEHGLTYQQALKKVLEADPAVAPKQPVKARLLQAGCSWWLEITDARYWQKDNDGRYGYRPFPLWPDTVTPTPALLDTALARHGWERHVEEWPAELGADAAVFLRRTRDGHAEDRERQAALEESGEWVCPAGLCGEYEEPTECVNCWGDSDCWDCNGTGMVEREVEHCCSCGGSPYCQCCKICGATCLGECRCPVGVYLQDGRLVTY